MNFFHLLASTLLVSGILVSGPVQAKTFQLGKGTTVKIDVPSGWDDMKDVFGIPLMLLGPMKNEERPVISLAFTGLDRAKLDHKELGKDEASFREGREKWLKKHGGRALAFDGYRQEAIPAASQAGSVGYRYELDGLQFQEKTYLIVCAEKLFYLKSTLSDAQVRAHGAIVDKTIRSFSCK